jgi:HAD superfamily hydrolase (TIGR01509 family)
MTDEAAEYARAYQRGPGLVIFDCDGVLVDSEALCNHVVAEELTACGWPMTTDEAERRFIGLTFPDTQLLAEQYLGRSLGCNWVDRVAARVTAVMAEHAAPIPGARAALEAATALRVPWRIASNSSHAEMAAKFRSAGLADLVAGRVHSAYDLIARGGRGKPAPELFLEAAAAEGVDPAVCLVIEDSLAGVQAAMAAGMACLALCPDGDGAVLRAADAVMITEAAAP